MSQKNTLYWYDLETFGIDPRCYRMAQFAGVRTDEDLNIIDEPLILFCKPADDMLPSPQSCLITGIMPQDALAKGVAEYQFIKRINDEFSKPNTCVVGYNNIRFDDEFIRYSLYRNFYDPYQREWKNGNSRWDIIDMVRLTRALRPSGINWPNHQDGTQSFKLEELTRANNISHEQAHDALSDVKATIAMAKLIKAKQSRLYEYIYKHRNKHLVSSLLNIREAQPIVHVSSMYALEHGCTAVVVPIALHPINKNGYIVYDLSVDPGELLNLGIEEIRHRLYTPRKDLPEGVDRIPLKTVHVNKCPIIVPLKTMDQEAASRLNIDLQSCKRHLALIKNNPELGKKAQNVFSDNKYEPNTDPDQALYSGFFGAADKEKMASIHNQSGDELSQLEFIFEDKRLPELLFRYRARNFPDSLSAHEQDQWQEYRQVRLTTRGAGGGITFDEYMEQIEQLTTEAAGNEEQLLQLTKLREYGQQILTKIPDVP